MNASGMLLRIATTLALLAAPAVHAVQGTVTQITSVENELRFWLAECGYEKFFYFSSSDASHDQAKLILMAAKFSGRPVSVPNACPAGDNVRATQVDLVQY